MGNIRVIRILIEYGSDLSVVSSNSGQSLGRYLLELDTLSSRLIFETMNMDINFQEEVAS